MFQILRKLFRVPSPVSARDEVAPGKAICEGVVQADEPLRSPVRGQACVAFFYRAFLQSQGMRGPTIQRIKEAEAYGAFRLQMEGGAIAVRPPRACDFDHAAHQELAKRYTQGFQAVEDVILGGARVRVTGRVKQDGGELVLHLDTVSVLEKQVTGARASAATKAKGKKKG